MKKLFLIAFIGLFTLNQTATAQEHRGKPDKGEMLERMKEKLNLSDAQVKQIQAIDAKYEGRESDLKSQMQALKQQHRALRDEKRAEIDKVLTAEQRDKIKTWKENRGERKKDMGRKPMRRNADK